MSDKDTRSAEEKAGWKKLNHPLHVGAGKQTRAELLIETRERIASVETEIAQNSETLDRIEDKVNDIDETVDEVDSNAMGEEYFDENFRDEITRNSKIAYLAVWAGSIALALIGLFLSLASLMGWFT